MSNASNKAHHIPGGGKPRDIAGPRRNRGIEPAVTPER